MNKREETEKEKKEKSEIVNDFDLKETVIAPNIDKELRESEFIIME